MKALLLYLAQVLVTSGILYSYYHFALRNKKFHRYNRFYLLASTMISIMVPFLNIPVYFSQTEADSSFILQTLTVFSSNSDGTPVLAAASPSQHTNWLSWEYLTYCIYILIACIALSRIIFSLRKIRRIVTNHPVEKLDNILFINTNEPGTPFSFFRWLFWNNKIELNSEKGEQIFRHELFHIEQKHSRDIMYLEILTVVCWLNPFFHLIKKEVKTIHEFLADQFAATENSRWQYAELLLMQALNTSHPLVNPFFHNQIKRRIAMITTSKKPGYQYLRKLMVFPVAVIVMGLFAFTYQIKQASKNHFIPDNHQNVSDTSKPLMDYNKIYEKVDIAPSFPGGDLKWREYVNYNLENGYTKYDKTAPKGTYTTVVLFIVDKEGNQSDVKALTHHGYGMEEAALRLIKSGPKWFPGVKNGNRVKAFKVQPITFVAEGRPSQKTDTKVIEKADTLPSFPGGESAWKKYLSTNINAAAPLNSGAPAGIYKVVVQFLVHENGFLSDIKAVTNHGYGMEEEAMRMIKKGPKWIPAKQNGHVTGAYVQQPVTFVISEEDGVSYQNTLQPAITSTLSTPKIPLAVLKKANVYKLLQIPEGTEIVSFMFTMDTEAGEIVEITNKGSEFNSGIRNLINTANPGRTMTVEQIRAKKEGGERILPPVIYLVID